MNSLALLIIALIVLACGYLFYGRYLCKKWGLDEEIGKTPAHTVDDGDVDYVPAKAPVVMGHHFSSIAGAGPITGPISAVALGFGWLPCTLWILIGGIFVGGVHDFGALVASLKHGGKSIGEIIAANISLRAKRLFIIFSYLTLILVVAAFASIVAGTFGVTTSAGDPAASPETNASVAMVSLLFIVVAIIFGALVHRRNAPVGVSTLLGIAAIAICMVIGMNFHPLYFTYGVWMIIVGIYITVASVTPVWILLQPRDYLSSFLLYAMLAIAIFAVFAGHPSLDAVPLIQSDTCVTPVFPVLFTTIACGACSGFHSLVSSGTTAKQLNKYSDAKPVAYGGMLLECVLAILTICAISYAFAYNATAEVPLEGATSIFAGGIAGMAASVAGGVGSGMYNILFTLLVLTYSAFCLTSLDTATRLARFMFQEFWIDSSKGETPDNVTGFKKLMVNPYFATILTVTLGIILGFTGYAKVWALFGSANQLLAALGLLAISAWLANAGRKNAMVVIPMFFMLCVTIASLIVNTKTQLGIITAGGADWGPYVQVVIGIFLVILAVELAYEGVRTIFGKKKEQAA